MQHAMRFNEEVGVLEEDIKIDENMFFGDLNNELNGLQIAHGTPDEDPHPKSLDLREESPSRVVAQSPEHGNNDGRLQRPKA